MTGSVRTLLVEKALEMLERAEDISLRGVARAAGLSAMTPYRHFPDKAALMGAIAREGFTALQHVLEEADEDTDPHRALTAQGLAYIAFAQARPALFRLMFTEPGNATLPDDCDRAAYRVLERRVEILAGDPQEPRAQAYWSLVHGLAMLTLDGRLPADPAMHRSIIGSFHRGLAAVH